MLFDHPFEEEHGQRHDSGSEALRLGVVGTRQRQAVAGFGNTHSGEENEAAILGLGLVELVLDSLGDPLFDSCRFAEEDASLTPFEPDETIGRLFDYLDLLDAGDDLGSVFDIGDGSPEGWLGGVDGEVGGDEHGGVPELQ